MCYFQLETLQLGMCYFQLETLQLLPASVIASVLTLPCGHHECVLTFIKSLTEQSSLTRRCCGEARHRKLWLPAICWCVCGIMRSAVRRCSDEILLMRRFLPWTRCRCLWNMSTVSALLPCNKSRLTSCLLTASFSSSNWSDISALPACSFSRLWVLYYKYCLYWRHRSGIKGAVPPSIGNLMWMIKSWSQATGWM